MWQVWERSVIRTKLESTNERHVVKRLKLKLKSNNINVMLSESIWSKITNLITFFSSLTNIWPLKTVFFYFFLYNLGCEELLIRKKHRDVLFTHLNVRWVKNVGVWHMCAIECFIFKFSNKSRKKFLQKSRVRLFFM